MGKNKVVSYSQYTTYHQCPQRYKLQYIDKKAKSEGTIDTVFGSALHETIKSSTTSSTRSMKRDMASVSADA